ncbi:MAG: OsmC family protein [Actinomycetota bacterium]|nr:OsmC family protein [Actinomycetota bacterium]
MDATAAAVSADGAKAAVVFRAAGRGESGVATDIRIGRHAVLIDEPPALGGTDAAPNPVETALAGLLSCQVVTYRFWAAKLGIPLDDVQVEAEGDLDVRGFFGLQDGVRPGFGDVRVKVRLTGPASPAQYRELQVAVDQHCPVLDLFSNPTSVHTELVAG